jgi:hypothetical protein
LVDAETGREAFLEELFCLGDELFGGRSGWGGRGSAEAEVEFGEEE